MKGLRTGVEDVRTLVSPLVPPSQPPQSTDGWVNQGGEMSIRSAGGRGIRRGAVPAASASAITDERDRLEDGIAVLQPTAVQQREPRASEHLRADVQEALSLRVDTVRGSLSGDARSTT